MKCRVIKRYTHCQNQISVFFLTPDYPFWGILPFLLVASRHRERSEACHCGYERSEAGSKKTCPIAEAGQGEGFFLGQTIV